MYMYYVYFLGIQKSQFTSKKGVSFMLSDDFPSIFFQSFKNLCSSIYTVVFSVSDDISKDCSGTVTLGLMSNTIMMELVC